MTIFKFTNEDRRLVVYGCGRAIEKLREYMKYHELHGETEDVECCLSEIKKHERMMERMKEAGPITVG